MLNETIFYLSYKLTDKLFKVESVHLLFLKKNVKKKIYINKMQKKLFRKKNFLI